MSRRINAVLAGLALAAVSTAPLAAQDEKPKPLVVAGKQVLILRVGDTLNGQNLTIEGRISSADNVLAKHLGSKAGKFTSKNVGARVHIYLNGDFLIAATPADAKATGFKDAKALAETWLKKLKPAFKEAAAP